jgi:hypothetical protein
MTECLECRIIFPDDCVAPMITTKGDTFCCALCALKIRNQIHGWNDKKFAGKKANAMLKRVKKFLEKREKFGLFN